MVLSRGCFGLPGQGITGPAGALRRRRSAKRTTSFPLSAPPASQAASSSGSSLKGGSSSSKVWPDNVLFSWCTLPSSRTSLAALGCISMMHLSSTLDSSAHSPMLDLVKHQRTAVGTPSNYKLVRTAPERLFSCISLVLNELCRKYAYKLDVSEVLSISAMERRPSKCGNCWSMGMLGGWLTSLGLAESNSVQPCGCQVWTPPPPSLPPQWNAKDPLQEHLLDSFLSVWVVKKELFGLFGDIKLKQAVCTSLFGRWNLALAHYRSETCMVLSSCNLLAKLCSTVEPVLNTLKIWVAWMADCLCYVNPWCHVVNGKRL